MTKDVIVSISGLQMPAEGEAEPVEVITVGDYYQKNGKHYVLYEEVNEGFEGSTKNIIKMQENCIDITKKGVSNVHMVFEKNRKNMSYYGTPFGNLLVGIDAKDIKEDCIKRKRRIQSCVAGCIKIELGENPALFLFYLPAFSFNFAIKPFFFLAGTSIGPRIPFTAVM